MFARIGVMRALPRHVERLFNSDCKDPHWGKRKLKRDNDEISLAISDQRWSLMNLRALLACWAEYRPEDWPP
jgi:hypothetical protein